MPTSTTGGRALAIAAGAVFLIGTLGILFEDVLTKNAAIQLKHGLTLVILAGTIMTGHLANGARVHKQFFSACGFTLVFLAGTALVVYSSVGRQAAQSIQTSSQIDQTNDKRADIRMTKAKAQAMLDQAQRALATECRTGAGSACRGIKTTIEVYQAAIAGHDAQLDKLGATTVAAPEAEQFAEISAVLFGADKARVKAGAILAVPFLVTLFLEFGSIVSLGYAFRAHPRSAAKRDDPEPELAPVPKPEAKHPVLRVLHSAGRPLTNDELATKMGVTKGESSKRRAEVAHLLSEQRDGKYIRISLAH